MNILTKTLESGMNLLAPDLCLGCGRTGSILCEGCRLEYCPSVPSRCVRCKALTDEFKTCKTCMPHVGATRVFVSTMYDTVPKALVRACKFESVRGATSIMGAHIVEMLPFLDDSWVVVPVPTITSHVRVRGFDHTQRIARAISKHYSLRYAPLLLRIGNKKQVGATREQRRSQLAGSMFARPNTMLYTGKNILLVDDVYTTGGTIAEAVRTLKAASCSRISAAVFAQKT